MDRLRVGEAHGELSVPQDRCLGVALSSSTALIVRMGHHGGDVVRQGEVAQNFVEVRQRGLLDGSRIKLASAA